MHAAGSRKRHAGTDGDVRTELEAAGRRRVKIMRRTSVAEFFPSMPTGPLRPPAMPAVLADLIRDGRSNSEVAAELCGLQTVRGGSEQSQASTATSGAGARPVLASIAECASWCTDGSSSASAASSEAGASPAPRGFAESDLDYGTSASSASTGSSPPAGEDAEEARLSPTALVLDHVKDLLRYYATSAVAKHIKMRVKTGELALPQHVYRHTPRPRAGPGPLGPPPPLPPCVAALAPHAAAAAGAATPPCPLCSARAARASQPRLGSTGSGCEFWEGGGEART